MNDDGFWLSRGLDTKFSFREATLPRIRQPSTRLQALVAESSEGHTHHTTAIYDSHCSPSSEHVFRSFRHSYREIKERFTVDDQDILCALGDVVLSNKPSEDSEDKVANFYELNKDLIQAGKAVLSCDSGYVVLNGAKATQLPCSFKHRESLYQSCNEKR